MNVWPDSPLEIMMWFVWLQATAKTVELPLLGFCSQHRLGGSCSKSALPELNSPLECSPKQSALEINWYQYLDFAEFLPPALKCDLSWVPASLEMGNQKWYPGRKSMWLIHLSIYPYFRKITGGTFSQDTCGRGWTPPVLWTESLCDPAIPPFISFNMYCRE